MCFDAMMNFSLKQSRQIVPGGDLRSHMYFHDLREMNLTQFDKGLEEIWLRNLKAYRQENSQENEHPADFPCKYEDEHFIGFSVMRFILFTVYLTLSVFKFTALTVDILEKAIEDSLSIPQRTLQVWRICWSSRNSQNFLSALPNHEKLIYDFAFVSSVERLLDNLDTIFPLQLNSLLNEGTMKFLRVFYSLMSMVKKSSFDFLTFFKLHKSREVLELFYERSAQNSSNDYKIVQYVSLNFESVLNCKRKIEQAKDGEYIAVKVFLQTKVEVLSSLEDHQELIHDKISLVNEKIEKTKFDLLDLTYTNANMNGLSIRKAASSLLERSKQMKELNEYLVRKKAQLSNLRRRYSENQEKIYIARQYEK